MLLSPASNVIVDSRVEIEVDSMNHNSVEGRHVLQRRSVHRLAGGKTRFNATVKKWFLSKADIEVCRIPKAVVIKNLLERKGGICV